MRTRLDSTAKRLGRIALAVLAFFASFLAIILMIVAHDAQHQAIRDVLMVVAMVLWTVGVFAALLRKGERIDNEWWRHHGRE